MRPREETRDTEEDHEDDKRSRRPLILPEFSLVEGHEAEVEAGEETTDTEEDHQYEWRLPLSNDL